MNPEIIKEFETGTGKAKVSLVKWGSTELAVRVSDRASNFTMFTVDSISQGHMQAEFFARLFRQVAPKRKRKV